MAKKKRKNAVSKKKRANLSWRKAVKHVKKVRRRLGIEDWDAPSASKQEWKRRTRKPRRNPSRRKPRAKSRKPVKLRKISRTTGWIRANAVRFVKNGGVTQVFVRRGKSK